MGRRGVLWVVPFVFSWCSSYPLIGLVFECNIEVVDTRVAKAPELFVASVKACQLKAILV